MKISGKVFLDANGMTDSTVNGVPWPNTTSLYVCIVEPTGLYTRLAATVGADGTYSFEVDTYNSNLPLHLVLLDINYEVAFLSSKEEAQPKLVRQTGVHIGLGPGNDYLNGSDQDNIFNAFASIIVNVNNKDVSDLNWGVDNWPTSIAKTSAIQPNPLGTARVQAPTLSGYDPEDGIYNPAAAIRLYLNQYGSGYGSAYSKLYYDEIPVIDGQIITNYDPTKLTVDPKDGNVTARFIYSVLDAAGVESKTPAVVEMPFSDSMSQLDFGDAPNIYFTVLDYTNGARHTIIDGLRIGTLIDADANGQINPAAMGDDENGIDDEDGVTSFPILYSYKPSYSLSIDVTNTTGSNATLSGWIDFNRNDEFSTDERAQIVVPSGVTSVTLSWPAINWSGGNYGTAGETFARFRLASVASEVAYPWDQAYSGEVEDYKLNILANMPLPVGLSRFEGHWVENKGNQLSWATAWEESNDHFEIQAGIDAKTFETVGRLAGQGTMAGVHDYEFVDTHPQADITYYRLKQVDLKGDFNYTRIIFIKSGIEAQGIKLVAYPNPTTDELRLQLNGHQDATEINIYSTTGTHIVHQIGSRLSVSVKSLPRGVYIVEVITAVGQIVHQRFVKQ